MHYIDIGDVVGMGSVIHPWIINDLGQLDINTDPAKYSIRHMTPLRTSGDPQTVKTDVWFRINDVYIECPQDTFQTRENTLCSASGAVNRAKKFFDRSILYQITSPRMYMRASATNKLIAETPRYRFFAALRDKELPVERHFVEEAAAIVETEEARRKLVRGEGNSLNEEIKAAYQRYLEELAA